jgi:hypothetical protein
MTPELKALVAMEARLQLKHDKALDGGQDAIGPHAAALNACKAFPDMQVKP